VQDGRYFTEAAGWSPSTRLLTPSPTRSPCFAWLLRWEAFERFGFDPDGVSGAADGSLRRSS
jgi:hypothetical protein